MEVLTAYLREHAGRTPQPTVIGGSADAKLRRRLHWPALHARRQESGRHDGAVEQTVPRKADRLPADVQAIATVIGRRHAEYDKSDQRLDLQGVALQAVNLGGAHLERAFLGGAQLERANLRGTHLEEADLPGANLEAADLYMAHLERAYLYVARLQGTVLTAR